MAVAAANRRREAVKGKGKRDGAKAAKRPATEAATRPTTDDELEPTLPVVESAPVAAPAPGAAAPPQAGKRLVSRNADGRGRKKSVKLSSRCGILLPPALVKKHLIRTRAAPNISLGAAIFLTGALETLISELLLGSMQACQAARKKVLTAQHFLAAIRTDDELNKIFCDAIVPRGGNPATFPASEQAYPAAAYQPTSAKKKSGGVTAPLAEPDLADDDEDEEMADEDAGEGEEEEEREVDEGDEPGAHD